MSTADWKPYDVPALAELLAQQPTDSGTHAMAWQQAYDTLTDQQRLIEAAHAALTQAWPAAPGSAAESFLDQVDAITQAMSNTAETAVNAHGALTGIVTAIDNATTKVDTLHQSWQQNQTVIGDTVPTSDWTQPLNDQAHTVMGRADTAIAEHTTQLAPPIPYSPQPSHQTSTPLQLGSSRANGHPSSSTRSNVASSSTSQPSRRPLLSAISGSAENTGGASVPSIQPSGRVGGLADTHWPVGVAADAAVTTGARAPSTGRDAGTASTASPDQLKELRNSEQGVIGGFQEPNGVLPLEGDISGVSRAGVGLNPARQLFSRQGSAGNSSIPGGSDGSTRPDFHKSSVTVHSDAIAATSTQGTSLSPMSGGSTANTEALPIGGMVTGAPTTSGARVRSNRRDVRVDWPMPVGVSPILEPADCAPILHDPGPGVIGIDR